MNQLRQFLSILICIAATSLLHAQPADTTAGDSLRVYDVPGTILVQADRIVSDVAASAQPLAVITAEEARSVGARDLSDIVGYVPGAFIKSYGGLGGLRTLSLRGTSAQQAVVLIDGVRYQGSSNGAIDLGNIPSSGIERVEVIRGGNAALYGANALGGVVNIITASPGERTAGLRSTISTAVGSFGERHAGVEVDAGIAGLPRRRRRAPSQRVRPVRHTLDLSANLTTTHGDYPFSLDEFGTQSTVRRLNADFTNLFARAAYGYQSRSGWTLRLSGQGFYSDRGSPGAVVQGHRQQANARLEESDGFVMAQLMVNKAAWQANVGVTGRINGLHYSDPDAHLYGPDGIDNRYDRLEGAATGRYRRFLGDRVVIDGSAEISLNRLEGDHLDPSVERTVQRLQAGAALASTVSLLPASAGSSLIADAALRFDAFSDLGAAVSPSLGVIFNPFNGPLRLRSHVAFSYRAPSFSEQYYLNFGNTDLEPERSRSIDAGATLVIARSLVLESSVFLIDTREQITAVPKSAVSWSAQNIGRVISRGVELAASGSTFDGHLAARASYTWMRAEDHSGRGLDRRLLVYSPQELFSGLADLRIGSDVRQPYVTAGINWQYVSHRHTLPLNTPQGALPGYWLFGASAGFRRNLDVFDASLRFDLLNILDTHYEVVRNYPMPGRTLRAGLEIRVGRDEG